jgi:hypothetical protein
MTEVTQPRMARGTKLFAGLLATALFALLAFAPFASAVPDPVGSGTTIITLNKGTVNGWKKRGVKISKVSPAKLSGTKATFTAKEGTVDPTTGLGTVTLNGGLKFKAGKKSTTVKAIVVDTSKKSLTANVGGKKLKMATITGFSFARNGFGVNLTIKKFKLTSAAAKQLNKKLGYTAKKGKGKGHKRAAASKVSSPPFKANQVLGSGSAEVQPSTVAVLPGGQATLALSASALQKLQEVGPPPGPGPGPFSVQLSTVAPTSIVAPGPPPTIAFPIGGGTISPTGAAGTVQTLGGLKLVQDLEAAPPPGTRGVTTLTLGNVWVDMGAKTATVEVVITNPKTPAANLGNLGRVSIADINLAGATITSDPVNHLVSVQNASATLQAVTAETLNLVFINEIEKATGEPQNKFAAGDPLGTFSFTVKTE